jgi:hypothetical protein
MSWGGKHEKREEKKEKCEGKRIKTKITEELCAKGAKLSKKGCMRSK